MYPLIENFVNVHGPSLGIGVAISLAAIFGAYFALNNLNQEKLLVFEEAQEIEQSPESQKLKKEVFTANASPYLGDENAPITMVEFGDYQCFFCNRYFHETEHEVLKNYVETGKVKILFKDFTIIGPDSINAAHATHCANEEGKFWEYHNILYNNWTGENNGWASSENLFKFAKEIGLDTDNFSECMLEARYQDMIIASNNDAKALGIDGTPGFFIIGPDNEITRIGGAQPYDVFKRIFDSELNK
jgi:protein-disulfide isomerase